MKRSYSTTELAKMWDVSESTIKRWADRGPLKCRKTVGGHRKFELKDILEFQSHCALSTKAAMATCELAGKDDELEELLAQSNFAALSDRYKTALLDGNQSYASSLLRRAYLGGVSLARIGDEIIRTAMQEIGEMWRAGKIGVLDEHMATFSTAQALAELRSITKKKHESGRLALVGCAEGELHHLASVLICYLLELEGLKVVHLGPHTPLFSFAEAVNRFKPSLLCISITMADNIERAARDYEGLRRAASKQRTRLVVGGAAMRNSDVRARFRGAHFGATLDDLLEMVTRQP
jgi:methanogenic corrinoid protein MtbC1